MSKGSGFSQTAKGVAAFLATTAVGVAIGYYIFYFGPIHLTTHRPVQPIAFSHKLHAGDNKIPCQYCHTFARRTEMAGVPSGRKCMNCHDFVKPEAPEIMKITDHVDNEKPIEWVKVFDLPDHVWFSHKRHIKKDIACQECHGPVETMEVVAKTNNFPMGFCLSCHQDKGAPTDCWTCHT